MMTVMLDKYLNICHTLRSDFSYTVSCTVSCNCPILAKDEKKKMNRTNDLPLLVVHGSLLWSFCIFNLAECHVFSYPLKFS